MKKTVIAAGIIVILGASYTIASWYTGQVIENKFDDTLANMAHQVNQYNHIPGINLPDIDIQYHDYNKGLFSTSVYLTVSTKDLNKTVLFDDKITIYHGPLPWSEVKTGHFSPNMASLVYQTTQGYNDKLWVAAGNKPFITANMLVDYSENITISVSNEPISYHDDQEKVQIETTENKLSIMTDKRFNNLSIEGHADKYAYANQSTGFNVSLEKVNFLAQLATQNGGNHTMNQALTVEKLTSNSAIIDQFKLTSNFTQGNAGTLAGEVSTSINDITYGQQRLGKGDMRVKYKMTSAIDEQTTPLKTMSISLDKLLWETNQGNLNANATLDIAGNSLKLDELDEDNVTFSEANIHLPLTTLAYLNAQINHAEAPVIDETEIKQSAQFVLLFSNLFLAKSPIIKVNNDPDDSSKNSLSVDLYYSKAEKRAKLKGEELSLGQFWHALYNNKLPTLK